MDYGLAYRYSPEGVLKEYKEDPKKCHDGTIEFTSIDAHHGVCVYILIKCFTDLKKKKGRGGQFLHTLASPQGTGGASVCSWAC